MNMCQERASIEEIIHSFDIDITSNECNQYKVSEL